MNCFCKTIYISHNGRHHNRHIVRGASRALLSSKEKKMETSAVPAAAYVCEIEGCQRPRLFYCRTCNLYLCDECDCVRHTPSPHGRRRLMRSFRHRNNASDSVSRIRVCSGGVPVQEVRKRAEHRRTPGGVCMQRVRTGAGRL